MSVNMSMGKAWVHTTVSSPNPTPVAHSFACLFQQWPWHSWPWLLDSSLHTFISELLGHHPMGINLSARVQGYRQSLLPQTYGFYLHTCLGWQLIPLSVHRHLYLHYSQIIFSQRMLATLWRQGHPNWGSHGVLRGFKRKYSEMHGYPKQV